MYKLLNANSTLSYLAINMLCAYDFNQIGFMWLAELP